MDLGQVVHMNGGDGETSYAKNSFHQGNAVSLTKPIRDEAITSLYSKTLFKSLAIADLGCSSGPNTLFVVSDIIMVVEKLCQQLNHSSPEYKIFFNDVSGNDFNNIFKSLDNFKEKLQDEIKTKMSSCYFFGVPGSFYSRVFPNRSLHFIHSSHSLQWLSKVPEGIENNKSNIYINYTSPSNVVKAYYDQFKRDFSVFLKCRAEELVEGGCMVLTMPGRRNEDPCDIKYCCYYWELLAAVLNGMVLEGIIKEDQVNTFNVPQYYPSPYEVELEVLNEGSFAINRLELFEAYVDGSNHHEYVYNAARLMRAMAEPLVVSHFGEDIIEEIFSRHQKIIIDKLPKEKLKAVKVIISLTRKA
ncbi:putative salicylate carboxymethyltransferase [Medicago truncatula]|uniref:Putative salicylate carboxymethyltransferase n=1 Tax=Medicago truncatula TaxID=3880 RepID=G7L6V5_MEDTR|nr:S-adenosyl-L-methionine:benzoic acid/salicylic acid carboxyl methyltransferase 3 [Medicago truncatula]AET01759.1 salicylic acid carboxyl methyltransferase [Medicago truncatula]RHN39454.1 putative salicylate carboxymethyltransferase [Medicago truncatula]